MFRWGVFIPSVVEKGLYPDASLNDNAVSLDNGLSQTLSVIRRSEVSAKDKASV
jgi:hypothetical protein